MRVTSAPGAHRQDTRVNSHAMDNGRSSRLALVFEWIRHHTGSMMATAVDFVIMIGCVELFHFSPVEATTVGALCGAFTSFSLGRHWVFHRADGKAAGQLFRYAMVAGASLGLNDLGEFLLVRAGLGYVVARVIVAVAVSNLWNYPLHKFFVFRGR